MYRFSAQRRRSETKTCASAILALLAGLGVALPEVFAAEGGAKKKSAKGVSMILRAEEETVKIGEPVRIFLDLKYEGVGSATYDAQGVGRGRAFRVTGLGGVAAPYVGGFVSTGGHAQTIQPGATIRLVDGLDLADRDYLFHQPGRYRIQFAGDGGASGGIIFSESNTVEITVTEGELRRVDKLVLQVLSVIPKGWVLGKSGPRPTNVKPFGRRPVESDLVTIMSGQHPKLDWVLVNLWQTDEAAEEIPPTEREKTGPQGANASPSRIPSMYLGRGAHGHLYIAFNENTRKAWPEVVDELRRALVPQPGE
jgi:hypothetical protein